MSTYMDQLKGKPAPFEFNGCKVWLRPLLFGERQELVRMSTEKTDDPFQLDRRIFALSLVDETGNRVFADESQVDGAVASEVVGAVAQEAAFRCGLAKRPDEKKAMPPSSSMTPETSSPSTSPAPAA